ncbi:MAG: putative quorum-sensing-regulated virulence factor [Acidimicrobiales bacterium]
MLTYEDKGVIPAPPPDVAFDGPLGECARYLAAGTDASPVALLGSLIGFCGPLLPVWGYWHARHTSSPYVALVGKQADGRKGTAMHRIKEALSRALGTEAVNGLTLDSLASGEALVKAMLDRDRHSRGVPTGVLFEEEYAAFLAAASRDGSTLDARMRAAFDGKQMSHRKVGEVLVVREPYWLSGLIAITPRELQERARKDSSWNGTDNRWLWLAVQRRDERVMSTEPDLPSDLADVLRAAHDAYARDPAQLGMTDEADDLLSAYGDHLRTRTTGSAAPLTRRYPTIAFRIALVHAAAEMAGDVGIDHVRRAIALCEYGRASLPFVFADTLGNAHATHLLRMLQQSESGVLTLTDLGREFMRDPIKRQVVIDDLQELGLARVVRVHTNGRARTELHLVPQEGALPTLPHCSVLPTDGLGRPHVRERSRKGRERVGKGPPKVRRRSPKIPGPSPASGTSTTGASTERTGWAGSVWRAGRPRDPPTPCVRTAAWARSSRPNTTPSTGMSPMPDPWQVLYLRADAPEEVVSAAHRALVRLLHPDRGGSTAAMAAVNSAHDAILGDTRGWRPPEVGDGLRAEVERLRAENARLRAEVMSQAAPSAIGMPMPWGKHEGIPLGQVPPDYLRWACRQDWLDGDLRLDIEDVLEWRRGRS